MAKTKSTDLLKEMEKQNLSPKEWVLIEEASNNSVYSKRQIQKLAERGNERIGTVKIGNTVLYNMKNILQYAANHQKKPILSPVWDEIEPIEGEIEAFYPLYGYDCKYFVTSKLRVIDCSNGQVLTPQPQKDTKGNLTGYMQVTLRKNGKDKVETMHRLTGYTQCKNSFCKNIYHHINNDKSNNKASNVLPVWKCQHDELHKILKGRKLKELTGDDRDEYNKMIRAIKEENKLYKIPHLDFESDDKFNYFMFVNKHGYRAYKQGKKISLDSIKYELAEVKRGSN